MGNYLQRLKICKIFLTGRNTNAFPAYVKMKSSAQDALGDMKEDLNMSEKEKKVVAPVEINEDELDLVAGGAYTREEWDAMTSEERKAAQLRSILAWQQKKACELD